MHADIVLENVKAAVALCVALYNFCRVHTSLRVTLAMQAGITDHIWSLGELLSFRLLQWKEAA